MSRPHFEKMTPGSTSIRKMDTWDRLQEEKMTLGSTSIRKMYPGVCFDKKIWYDPRLNFFKKSYPWGRILKQKLTLESTSFRKIKRRLWRYVYSLFDSITSHVYCIVYSTHTFRWHTGVSFDPSTNGCEGGWMAHTRNSGAPAANRGSARVAGAHSWSASSAAD